MYIQITAYIFVIFHFLFLPYCYGMNKISLQLTMDYSTETSENNIFFVWIWFYLTANHSLCYHIKLFFFSLLGLPIVIFFSVTTWFCHKRNIYQKWNLITTTYMTRTPHWMLSWKTYLNKDLIFKKNQKRVPHQGKCYGDGQVRIFLS